MSDFNPDPSPKGFHLQLSPAAEKLLVMKLHLLGKVSRVQWATQVLTNELLAEREAIRAEFEAQARSEGREPEELLLELRQPKTIGQKKEGDRSN